MGGLIHMLQFFSLVLNSPATGEERSILPFVFLGIAIVLVIVLAAITIIKRKK